MRRCGCSPSMVWCFVFVLFCISTQHNVISSEPCTAAQMNHDGVCLSASEKFDVPYAMRLIKCVRGRQSVSTTPTTQKFSLGTQKYAVYSYPSIVANTMTVSVTVDVASTDLYYQVWETSNGNSKIHAQVQIPNTKSFSSAGSVEWSVRVVNWGAVAVDVQPVVRMTFGCMGGERLVPVGESNFACGCPAPFEMMDDGSCKETALCTSCRSSVSNAVSYGHSGHVAGLASVSSDEFVRTYASFQPDIPAKLKFNELNTQESILGTTFKLYVTSTSRQFGYLLLQLYEEGMPGTLVNGILYDDGCPAWDETAPVKAREDGNFTLLIMNTRLAMVLDVTIQAQATVECIGGGIFSLVGSVYQCVCPKGSKAVSDECVWPPPEAPIDAPAPPTPPSPPPPTPPTPPTPPEPPTPPTPPSPPSPPHPPSPPVPPAEPPTPPTPPSPPAIPIAIPPPVKPAPPHNPALPPVPQNLLEANLRDIIPNVLMVNKTIHYNSTIRNDTTIAIPMVQLIRGEVNEKKAGSNTQWHFDVALPRRLAAPTSDVLLIMTAVSNSSGALLNLSPSSIRWATNVNSTNASVVVRVFVRDIYAEYDTWNNTWKHTKFRAAADEEMGDLSLKFSSNDSRYHFDIGIKLRGDRRPHTDDDNGVAINIGIGVGVGVGVPMLLTIVVVILLLVRRKRHLKASAASRAQTAKYKVTTVKEAGEAI